MAQASHSERQVVLFDLGGATYGFDVADVREVTGVHDVAPAGGAPSFVEGTVCFKGRHVGVINLRARFGLPRRAPGPHDRIIMLSTPSGEAGIAVDAVTGLCRVPAGAVRPAPAMTSLAGAFIAGVVEADGAPAFLLDAEAVASYRARKGADEAGQAA